MQDHVIYLSNTGLKNPHTVNHPLKWYLPHSQPGLLLQNQEEWATPRNLTVLSLMVIYIYIYS